MTLAFTLLRILLLLVNDGRPARQHAVVQGLGFLVNLAVTASTEERYSEVLPRMAESSNCVLVHYPECDLLPLVPLLLGLVEVVDHILPLVLKVHLGEDHCYKRTGLILANERLQS